MLGFRSRVLDFSPAVLGWSASQVFRFSFDLRRRFGLKRRNLGTSELRHLATTERLSDGTSREMGGALAPPFEHLVYIYLYRRGQGHGRDPESTQDT